MVMVFSSDEGHMMKLDVQQFYPRFKEENLTKNEELRDRVRRIADMKKCSLNQLALAWVHHRGRDVVPIPGKIQPILPTFVLFR